MNENLNDLYSFPENITERDIYIEDLAMQCQQLENRIKNMLDSFPPDCKDLLLSYLELRDELEVYTVRKAICFGRKTAAP